MTMRLVRPCNTASYNAEATCEITDHGQHLSWHCRKCMDIIVSILEMTSKMVHQGTPQAIAAHWAHLTDEGM